MMMASAPLLFEEATNADGVWTLVVRSSDGVVGHMVWTMSAADYYTLRAAAVDPRKDAVLGTARWTIGGKMMEETPSLGWWVDIDVVLDHVGKPVDPIRESLPSYSLVTWTSAQYSRALPDEARQPHWFAAAPALAALETRLNSTVKVPRPSDLRGNSPMGPSVLPSQDSPIGV
jgi:hypothetical protein